MPALGLQVAFGLAAGLSFHPGAVLAVAFAGALWGRKGASKGRVALAASLLVAAWLGLDGVRLASSAFSQEPRQWLFLAAWGLVGLLAGYVGPALAGRAVGLRVTHGTGWLSAAAVGASVCLGLFAAGGTLAAGLIGGSVVP